MISMEKRAEFVKAGRRILKLELRDNCAIGGEGLKEWRSDDHERFMASCRAGQWVEVGRTLRRDRVVSEPLAECRRMSVRFPGSVVETRENLRWLPRRLTSALLLPGNVLFVLDDQAAIFNALDGADNRTEKQLFTDADLMKTCRNAFEAAWSLAVPHRDFRTA
nr:DUF6879 family protein [Actinomadura hibisca]